jgi:hypothetical protein
MMVMLSENSKQQTSRTTLVWVFVIIDVWATSNVKMTIVLSLFALVFGMKSHGQVTPRRFLLQVILPLVLLCAHLFTNFVLVCISTLMNISAKYIMLSTNSLPLQR